MAAVGDMMRNTLRGKKTTVGSARALFFNCKNQSENVLWYTSKLSTNEIFVDHAAQDLSLALIQIYNSASASGLQMVKSELNSGQSILF
jgi:hypothetical protein